MSALLSINGQSVEVKDALRRSIMHDEDFLKNTTEGMLIRQYAEKNGISNSDEELQVAVDEMRYQKGMEKTDKVNQWLKSNSLTVLSVQNAMDGMLLRNKVRNSIPDSEVKAYYAEHQLEFDKVELYSIRTDKEETAKELHAQVKEEGGNFHVLAMEHSTDEDTKRLGGYVGQLTRGGMTGEVEAAVFKAKEGDVIGPMKTEKGYNLFKVNKVLKADFEKEKDGIQLTLFSDLLTKLRAEAKISHPILEEE